MREIIKCISQLLYMIKRPSPWKKIYDDPRQHIKKKHSFADKGLSSPRYGFSSSQVWV